MKSTVTSSSTFNTRRTACRKQSILLHASSILSIILSFLLSFLNASAYGIFRLETLYLSLLCFVVLICIFFFFYFFRLEWIFQAALLLVVLDLIFGICGKIYLEIKTVHYIPSEGLLFLSYFFPFAALSSITYLLRQHIATIFAASWGIFLMSSILLLPSQYRPLYHQVINGESQGNGKPNILFIVLDEHIGISGIPEDISGGSELKKQMKSFYQNQGFQVFDRAFSNYGYTELSLSSVMNGEILTDIHQRRSQSLTRNRLFSKLFHEGFAINVYRNTYLDFCSSSDFQCAKQFIYSHNSPGYVSDLNIPRIGKMWILVDSFISAQKSYILNLLESYKLQKNIAPIGTGSLAAPRVIQELKHDLAEKKSGQFFFVHLLLPHYSYVYQQDCSVRDWDLWTNPYIKTKKKDAIAARENKYKAYLSQVECTQKLVQGLLDFLHKSGTFDAMSIVIIGDHGSRISVTRWDEYFTKMTKQDYVSWFSALALMKPGIYNTGFARKTGGSDQTALAVIVAEFLKLPLTSKASDFEHVYFPLDDRFVRMEMTDLH